MAFTHRWSIEGTLVTRTPLHIGGGEAVLREIQEPEGSRQVEVAAVALDHLSRPYLPGTSLKGIVRAWLKAGRLGAALDGELFGSMETGGKAEFWDAPLIDEVAPKHPPPHWNARRQVGTEVGVAIDRLTGTASDRKLFHRELVPVGAAFRVTVTGLDLDDAEVALLLAGLAGFNHAQVPIALGAEGASSKGLCTWTLDRVRRMAPDDLAAWLAAPTLPTAQHWMPDIGDAELARLKQAAGELSACAPRRLRIGLRLLFDEPFLVNDPPEAAEAAANHRPRRDADGEIYLPASSARGALRAQAERILRTLGAPACRIDDPSDACPPLKSGSEPGKRLCLACQVFGAAGWRSPVGISDFKLVDGSGRKLQQELIAIDRFTGGGAEGLKFNAESRYAPVLEGAIEIDLGRIECWGLGLLALTLRDLAEGDIAFGLKAAAGYGRCRGRVAHWSVSPAGEGRQAATRDGEWPPVLDQAQRERVQAAIRALRDQATKRLAEEAQHGQ